MIAPALVRSAQPAWPSLLAAAVVVLFGTFRAAAHPVVIYDGEIEFADNGVTISLEADAHTLSHDAVLFRRPPDPRLLLAELVSSIDVRTQAGDRLAFTEVETASLDGDAGMRVSAHLDTTGVQGLCSIRHAPQGPLATGTRQLSLTIHREDADPRRIVLTSAGNHEVLSLGKEPTPDPDRFTRPRLTLASAADGNTLVTIDVPATLVDLLQPKGETFDERWAVSRIDLGGDQAATFVRSVWVDPEDRVLPGTAKPGSADEPASTNPCTTRWRTELVLPGKPDSFRWHGFTRGVLAWDAIDARENPAGTRRVLNERDPVVRLAGSR